MIFELVIAWICMKIDERNLFRERLWTYIFQFRAKKIWEVCPQGPKSSIEKWPKKAQKCPKRPFLIRFWNFFWHKPSSFGMRILLVGHNFLWLSKQLRSSNPPCSELSRNGPNFEPTQLSTGSTHSGNFYHFGSLRGRASTDISFNPWSLFSRGKISVVKLLITLKKLTRMSSISSLTHFQ